MTPWLRRLATPTAGYAVALFLVGLAYRATFLSQGFAATDEGWLQSMGSRIAAGQVPYRDFDHVMPPVSLYKEALFIRVFGDAYGVLASRWAFAVEVSLGSVLAFLIMRRFVSPRLAFLVTLPTAFFSVILYYFSNYNYDAEVLLLAACLLLVYTSPRWPWLALLAGAAAALAFLAKPTYGGFLPLIPIVGLARLWGRATLVPPGTDGTRQRWPLFLLGAGITIAAGCAYFLTIGAFNRFFSDSFLLTRQANPTSLRFLLIQDLPSYLLQRWEAVLPLIACLLILFLRPPALNDTLRSVALAAVLLLLLGLTFWSQPIDERPVFLVAAYGLLLVLNLIALVATVRGAVPFPVELPLFGLALQYLAQIAYAGVLFYYVGAFLTVPIALLLLAELARGASLRPGRVARAVKVPLMAASLIGLWFSAGSILVTRGIVYEDGQRAQLTGVFESPKLKGIRSLPSTTQRVDTLIAAVQRHSRPGDPIFVFPDLEILYFVTDRPNPTRTDWYNPGVITVDLSRAAAAALAANPPRVVLLQSHREWDFRRELPPLRFDAEPKWAPIYQYLVQHFKLVEKVQDVEVLVPD